MNTHRLRANSVRNSGARSHKPGVSWMVLVVALLVAVAPWAIRVGAQPPAASAGGAAVPIHDISVAVGRSSVIATPWPVKRISVTDPKIADVKVVTPGQVMVSGKAVGATDVFMWNQDEQMWQGRVEVEIDRTAIKKELAHLFPSAHLELRQSRDLLLVCGVLSRAEQAEQLHRFLDTYSVKYVDMTTVAGVQQVQLKVVVAEASRTAIRTLGMNAFLAGSSAFGGTTIGPDGGGPINPISIGVPSGSPVGSNAFQFLGPTNVGSAVTLFGGVPGSDLQVFISALAENQYMRVLAEPSLVALSGQEANFLAGGEYPIPVVQGAGATTSGSSISIDYKEYGIRLRFKPTVLGDGTIRLHVAPEVSQLTTQGAVTIQGFTVPALLTRRAETTLELASGQTFGMAGLINESVQARNSRVPGLGDVPVLGALFRSVRYQRGDTELIVLVTASLVEPLSVAHQPLAPGTLHVAPNDWELYGMGQIEGNVPAKVAPVDSQYLQQTGLTRLRGPGAWATFESPPVPSRAPLHAEASTLPAVKSGKE